jgi:hypothetical protein
MEMTKDQQELHDELEALRARIISEKGTGPPCPYCGVPRVTRSSYIRCNPCGKNWMNGADISRHPYARTVISAPQPADESAEDAE